MKLVENAILQSITLLEQRNKTGIEDIYMKETSI